MNKSIRTVIFLVVAIASTALPAVAQTPPPPASFVEPLIGTDPNPFIKTGILFDTGNVFPGAVCPRGMVAK